MSERHQLRQEAKRIAVIMDTEKQHRSLQGNDGKPAAKGAGKAAASPPGGVVPHLLLQRTASGASIASNREPRKRAVRGRMGGLHYELVKSHAEAGGAPATAAASRSAKRLADFAPANREVAMAMLAQAQQRQELLSSSKESPLDKLYAITRPKSAAPCGNGSHSLPAAAGRVGADPRGAMLGQQAIPAVGGAEEEPGHSPAPASRAAIQAYQTSVTAATRSSRRLMRALQDAEEAGKPESHVKLLRRKSAAAQETAALLQGNLERMLRALLSCAPPRAPTMPMQPSPQQMSPQQGSPRSAGSLAADDSLVGEQEDEDGAERADGGAVGGAGRTGR